jgi:hypothetical protein
MFVLAAPLLARALDPGAHERPPGIAASAWVPITNDLAAVVERPAPTLYAGNRQVPSAQGYFVLWREGHWLRLDSLLLQPPMRRSPPVASERMSISGNLAFVIERQAPGQLIRGELPAKSAHGYFVIKRGGHWLRLSPVPQDALFRGPLRRDPNPKWIAVTRNLRFVIEQQMPQRHVSGQLPSVLGYFMAKRGSQWLRLGSIA